MEIRVDQLLLVVLVVLFTLADVVFRHFRKRGASTSPEQEREEESSYADHEVAYEDEIRPEDTSVLEDVFAPPLEPEVQRPAVPPPVPLPQAMPVSPSRDATRPPASWQSAATLRRRRTAALGVALDAREARRAIVLMTVFGPCRALESDHRV